jgi:hypothetical protein
MTKVLRCSSPSAIRALIAIAAAFAGGDMASADARSSTITLDFEHGTISPGDPTINLNAQPSVVVEMVPAGQYRIVPTGTKSAKAATDINTRASSENKASPGAAPKSVPAITVGDRVVFNFVGDGKDTIDSDGTWSWTVHMKKGMRDYPIDVICESFIKDGKKAPCSRAHMLAVIHVETAPYDFAWSAGLAVNSLRDTRYRIDPNPDDTNHSKLVRNGHGGYPYELATAANFCLVRQDWLCPISVGVSTAIPVDRLTILLGPAVRFRPLDISNSLYLSVGVAYGSRKELNDDYAGRSTVPAGTTSASILTDRRGFGGYVGLTFGFLGSADKFKGVFSGSGEKTAEAPSK